MGRSARGRHQGRPPRFDSIWTWIARFEFPITLIVSPIYGVLAHGGWLGVLLFAIGPVTYLLLGLLGAVRIGDPTADEFPDGGR